MADEHHSAALSTPPRDKRDAALDIARNVLWTIWHATNVPAHKRTDTEFLRGAALVANEQAHHAMRQIDSLLGKGEGR